MVLDVHIHKHSEFSSSLKYMLTIVSYWKNKSLIIISSYSSAQWWSNTKFMSGIRPLNLEPIEHNQKLLNIKSFGSQINQYNWIYDFLYT